MRGSAFRERRRFGGYNSRMETQQENATRAEGLHDGQAMRAVPRLLVVDDEAAIADLVAGVFKAEGMDVFAFTDPHDALRSLEANEYDLAIVDIMMPVMDGYELCRNVRKTSDMPIVFLSAKDAEADIVAGFTIGADDYVTKPFKPRELVARVKAHIRRHSKSASGASDDSSILRAQGLEVDVREHVASLHDVPLQLTPKEFDILVQLLERKGQPVPSAQLYEAAWGEPANASSSNTVMVHIRHLRCKLAKVDSSAEIIETAWGVGYRIAYDKSGGKDG